MAKKKEKTKAKQYRNDISLRFGIVFLIFGILLLCVEKTDFLAGFTKPYDIYDVDAQDIKKGTLVTGDIYAVLDTFGTLETTHTKNGAVTSRSYHYFYIIPVFDDDNTYYIAVKVSSDDRTAFENIADDTWDYLYGYTDYFTDREYELTGTVSKLDDEAYEYMCEWFEEAEWFEDDDDIEKYVWPVMIEPKKISSVRFLSFLCLGLMIAGVALIVVYIRGGLKRSKKNKAETQTAENYDGYINIAGIRYLKSDFDTVNSQILAGDMESAVMGIRDRTGMGAEEARNIADNWNIYYN